MTSWVSSFVSAIAAMHFTPSSCVVLVSLLLPRAISALSEIKARDLTSFVTTERAIALQGALNNIGPQGSKVAGAGAGFVVASPSKVNPDCKSILITC